MKMIPAILLFLFFSITNVSVSPISVQQESSMSIHAIGWNGDYWLIGGRILPEGPTFLVTYNGIEFRDVASPLIKKIWIKNILWNDSEWFIKEMENTHGSKNRTIIYDENNFKIIENPDEEKLPWNGSYRSCNKDYCLVWDKSKRKLLKYDGEKYIDMTNKSGLQFPFENVMVMVWNGNYWLIGTGDSEGGRVIKYDGKSFVSFDFPNLTPVDVIGWNGEYWLIGTVASPRHSGSLIKYDGETFIDLSTLLKSDISPFWNSNRIPIAVSLIVVAIMLILILRIRRT